MKLIDYVLDLMYPPRCILCRKILRDKEKDICHSCADIMPRLLNFEPRRDLDNIRLCVAPFVYRDELRKSLHRYKFSGAAAYGRIYADFIAKSIDENAISCDIISWVPVSKRRLRERGYDQSEIIARALADILGVPCQKLLCKVKENKRQSSLSSKEARKHNVAGAYRCISEEDLIGKRVLIVDDIVTTGETISEAAKMLKCAGCTEIYAAAAALRI